MPELVRGSVLRQFGGTSLWRPVLLLPPGERATKRTANSRAFGELDETSDRKLSQLTASRGEYHQMMEPWEITLPFFLVLAVRCAIASFISVPEPGLMDNFTIIHNKILKTAVPLATAIVRSHIECAKLCTNMHWKCFGANVRRLSTDGRSLLCEAFWVSLPDLSRLEDSDGDLYLNPGRPNYWVNVTTGHADLSTNCAMCICRESGCEDNIGRCFLKNQVQVCGPFAITKSFWCDATYTDCKNADEEEYKTCTKTLSCSTEAMVNYNIRYERICVPSGTLVCADYSTIMSSGPFSCGTQYINEEFLANVAQCCSNHGGC